MIDMFDDYILSDDELLGELIEKCHKEIHFNDDITDEEAEELVRQLQTPNPVFEEVEKKPFKVDLDEELKRATKEQERENKLKTGGNSGEEIERLGESNRFSRSQFEDEER